MFSDFLKADPQVWEANHNELKRQNEKLELIASENFTSLAVMAATRARARIRAETDVEPSTADTARTSAGPATQAVPANLMPVSDACQNGLRKTW